MLVELVPWQESCHSLVLTCFLVSIELSSSEGLVAGKINLDGLSLITNCTEHLKSSLQLFVSSDELVGLLRLRGADNATESVGVVGGDHSDEASWEKLIEQRMLQELTDVITSQEDLFDICLCQRRSSGFLLHFDRVLLALYLPLRGFGCA